MKKYARIITVLTIMMAMVITAQTSALAKAPTIEDIEHKGSGRIEVDFYGNVEYKNCSVSVKDTNGNKYGAKNLVKDDDDITFTIKNYKKGKTYKVTVSGVRKAGTTKYGKVTGKITIPANKNSISRKKAISIAKNHAKNKWGADNFTDVEAEKDTYKGKAVWEISFDARTDGKLYEYEYEISRSSGKILHYERERD